MPKKMTLTPKDCLYIEDIVNASMLVYKKTKIEQEQLQSEELNVFLDDLCSTLKQQAQMLTDLMKGNE